MRACAHGAVRRRAIPPTEAEKHRRPPNGSYEVTGGSRAEMEAQNARLGRGEVVNHVDCSANGRMR